MKLICKHCSKEFEFDADQEDKYYDFEFDINTENPNYWKNFETLNAIMNTYSELYERIGFKVNVIKDLHISKGVFCPNCEYFYTNNELVKMISERLILSLDKLINKVDLTQGLRKAAIDYFKEKQNEIDRESR